MVDTSRRSNSRSNKDKSITNALNFNKPSSNIFQSQYQDRLWLKKHGKKKYIQFDDEEIRELRKYFNSLDNDGSGSIGVEELEDPLIALGLANSREEVEKLVKAVDKDGSGQIEFEEFLSIMSSIKNDESEKSPIFIFFKRMINGELMDQMDKNLPFKLNVSQFRRKKILDAIMQNDSKKKEAGNKILQAFKKQVILKKKQTKISKGENPNDISIDQIPNQENGVNVRTGFPKFPRILKHDSNFLIKPKSVPIQANSNNN